VEAPFGNASIGNQLIEQTQNEEIQKHPCHVIGTQIGIK
jgi:hypothetical protein